MRNDQYVAEIITTMGSSDQPSDFYVEGMNAICWTIRHAKAHPDLRRLGEWAHGFNIRRGLSNADDREAHRA